MAKKNEKAKAANPAPETTPEINVEMNENPSATAEEPADEPAQPADAASGLEEEVARLREQVAAEKNDYLRLMAEFETFRRRTAQEKIALVGTAAADTIKGLLPVLDDCERALDMLKDSSDEAARTGTALIYNKLMAYLKTQGLEPIQARDAKFDTDFHEAVAQLPVEDPARKGCVYDVVETGYLLNGKVLRYAKVVVGI